MPRRRKCKCPVCLPAPLLELSSRLSRDRRRAVRLTSRFQSYILDGRRVSGGQYVDVGAEFSVNVKHLYPQIFKKE